MRDDCKTRKGSKYCNAKPTTTKTIVATINNISTTTDTPPKNGQQPRPLVGGCSGEEHKSFYMQNLCPQILQLIKIPKPEHSQTKSHK